MQKIIKYGWVLIGLMLIGILGYGLAKMFFHQDDLDWFLLVSQPLIEVLKYPIGDHVNYLFRLMFKAEWEMFGLNYGGYLFVSVLIHAGVIALIYRIAQMSSGRRDLAYAAAIIFTINTNWNEVVLWISGQTISMTVLFVLWAMKLIWEKRAGIGALIAVGMTSALALGLPLASLINYGYDREKGKITKLGIGALSVLVMVGGAYLLLGGDGTKIIISGEWITRVIMVAGLMFVNTVVGRLGIPFDRLETMRILSVCFLIVLIGYQFRSKLRAIWKDEWSRFLILQMVFYNVIVAVGRAQFGVGIMRAERYAYLGIALFLLLAVRALRSVQIKQLPMIVLMIVVIQGLGFYQRAETYIERPKQMKELFHKIEKEGILESQMDDYLPHFVLNDQRLKYRDLAKLLND